MLGLLKRIPPQQRIAIAAFIVLAVLFVLATAHRPGGGGDLAHPGGAISWFGKHFGGTPDASRAELSAPCLQQDVLKVHDGTCTLTVARADKQRNVRLRTDSDVAVQAPAPGRDTLVRSDVEAGHTVSVAVGEAGADIDVICAGERTCTLTLVTGE